MNLATIQQNINALLAETADFQPESFKEKLYCAYRTKLLEHLKNCKSAEDFKEVLARNWILVKGNALCYTARPDDPLTELLCEIAEDISEELNIFPIHLLMPKITFESMFGKEDSTYQDYPDLNELPLRKLLKSHILSDSGSYLIPVRTLLELPDPLDNNPNQLGNYYYDMDDETAEGYVTNKEFNRLRRHSTHTQALVKAQEDYKALAKDAGLLSQLKALIDALRFNSTAGIGSEKAAGQGAYWALAQFNDYFQQLGKAVEDIPLPVKTAIDRLNTIASDAAENHVATTNTETCVNTRQLELSMLLNKHEEALASIGLDNNHQAKLLKAARKCYEENKQALTKLLINDQLLYAGQDVLCLNQSLLNTYQVVPKITSMDSLQDFLSLSPDEIKVISDNFESVKAGILRQFPNIEALVDLFLTTPLEPLEALISVMGKSLCDKLITKPIHISACLMLMEGPRLKHMMQLLVERLPTLIDCASNFKQVLQYLNHEQRSTVYETLKSKLPTLIKCSGGFAAVLRYLSPEQRNAVYEALKPQFLTLIKNASNFGLVLQYLSPEKCTVVCDALKAQLPTLIKSSYDLRCVLEKLSFEQHSVVCKALESQLPTLHENCSDFGFTLAYLSPELCRVVCEALKARLPVIIKNSEDFGQVLATLEPEQCSAVCEALKAQLPGIIKNGEDFCQVLVKLKRKQIRNVYEIFKVELPNFIKCAKDFNEVLTHLSHEQRSAVYESFKAQLPTIIQSGVDFGYALQYLSSEQCSAVYETSKAQLPTLIKSPGDFAAVLEYLSPEQRSAVYEASKAQLLTLIKSPGDFAAVLKYLSPEQRSAVYEASKAQLLTLIKSGADFKYTLKFLSLEQRSVVYDDLKAQFPTIIKNVVDFKHALEFLSLEQRSPIYEAFKAQLPTLIKNATFFKTVLEYLSAEQRMEVFHLFKTHLIKIIEQGVGLNNLPDWFASEKCLQALGCSANEKQELQAEMRAILESAKQKRNNTLCPGFENRKRKISQMQETDPNDSQKNKLRNYNRGK